MLNKINKTFFYLRKLLLRPNPFALLDTIRHVQPKHFLNALAADLDGRPIAVEFRHRLGLQDLHFFKKMISHRRSRYKNRFFLWQHRNRFFCASHLQFLGLYTEYLSGEFDTLYPYDWKDKVVLDIGGFIGDSALFFLEKGASSVVIYEPLPENIFSLRYNLDAYRNRIRLEQKAVSDREGPITLTSNEPAGSAGFGMQKGNHRIPCDATTFSRILESHPADAIKVDCEGAEQYLTSVSDDKIRRIPYWIIETHSSDIENAIKRKFQSSGYSLLRQIDCAPSIRVLHFKIEPSVVNL